jgi:hypothetical protein
VRDGCAAVRRRAATACATATESAAVASAESTTSVAAAASATVLGESWMRRDGKSGSESKTFGTWR